VVIPLGFISWNSSVLVYQWNPDVRVKYTM